MTVDEYIASFPAEKISYQIPTVTLDGEPLVHS
jgi:hypothetical protein